MCAGGRGRKATPGFEGRATCSAARCWGGLHPGRGRSVARVSPELRWKGVRVLEGGGGEALLTPPPSVPSWHLRCWAWAPATLGRGSEKPFVHPSGLSHCSVRGATRCYVKDLQLWDTYPAFLSTSCATEGCRQKAWMGAPVRMCVYLYMRVCKLYVCVLQTEQITELKLSPFSSRRIAPPMPYLPFPGPLSPQPPTVCPPSSDPLRSHSPIRAHSPEGKSV